MPYQPFEGHPVLAAIHFQGNHGISDKELLDHIVTAPSGGFIEKTARYYDADLFAIDLKRIVRWYNQKGYYEAKIDDVQEQRDDKGRVILLVKVDEGRRAFIKQMDYEGLEDLPKGELSDLNDALPIHPGDPFDEDGYEKAKDELLDQLKEHGFAQAHVEGRVEVAPEDGAAHVIFKCDKGQRFKFGKVLVTGNRQIPADQIATATGIDKGEQYSPVAIALAQQRVYNLGAFSGVRVGLEPLGDTPVAAVRVNVREAPFQTARFGLGGSIEQTRWELPRLRGEYTNRSLFGGLRRLELASTVGYAFVNSPLDYDPAHSGITAQNSAQVTVPNVLLPGLDWITRAEFDREVQGGYSYDEVAGRVGLLYRRGRHSVAPSLNFVRYFLVDLRGTELSDVINRSGTAAGIFQDCSAACTLTYPEVRYTYDGRDNAIEPTQGWYGTVSFQQTLKPGSFSYFRVNPDVRAYLPFTKYAVLAGRVSYGGLFTEGGSHSPFTQRFFMGGQNDQRGYAPLREGPKLGATTTSCNPITDPTCSTYATVGVPIGGDAAIIFSAEVRIHADFILNHLGIVPFVDASRVGDDPKDPFAGSCVQVSASSKQVCSPAGLEIAPGLGLRYITAFGPLRFDIAYVINPKDVTTEAVTGTDPATGKPVTVVQPTRVSSFCKSGDPTCIHESRWAFHVTLGEAF